jgi:hypothetical protein
LVVALSPEQADAARLYAHLTERTPLALDGPGELQQMLESASVLVLHPRHVTEDLLERLARSSRPVGLVVGTSQEELYQQVLHRAAARWLSGSPLKGAVALTIDNVTPGQSAGKLGEREEIEGTVGGGAGLLAIIAHSNGLDLKLGTLIGCPMEPAMLGAFDNPRQPSCLLQQRCMRLGIGIREGWAQGRFISPAAFACRLLFFGVCYGFQLAEGPLDPSYAFLTALLRNPRIGAIATSWNLIHTGQAEYTGFIDQVKAGRTIGQATRCYNSQHERVTDCLVLFGDPEASLEVPPMAQPQPSAPAGKGTLPSEAVRAPLWLPEEHPFRRIGALSVLDYALQECLELVKGDTRASFEQTRREIAGQIQRLRRGAPPQEAGEHLDTLLLDAVLSIGRPFGLWRSRATSQSITAVTCTSCHGRAHLERFDVRIPGAAERKLIFCARCQVTCDAPAALDVTLSSDGRAIQLQGEMLRGSPRAALMRWSATPRDGTVWTWPAAPGGALSSVFEIPDDWPACTQLLSFFAVSRGEFVMLHRLWSPHARQ